jgi:DNA primase
MHQLETHPNLKKVVLCLDNDEAGQSAAGRIRESLYQKGYSDVTVELPLNKDWDEDLQVIKGVKSGIKPKEEKQWMESERSSLSLS